MGRLGWVYVGCAGLLGVQLSFVACKGKTTSNPESDAGGSSNDGVAGRSGGSGHAGSSSGGSSSGTGTDLDSFLEAEGDSFCSRLFRCYEGDDDFSGERIVLKNEQGCKDLLARINAGSRAIADLRARIASGNVRYAPENGEKCLADLATCNGVDSFNDGACREAFEGDAKTGEACRRSEDCAGDAYCNAFEACAGQCAPRKPAGAECQHDSDCAYTTGAVFCDFSGTTGVCRELTRAPKAGLGEPCSRNLEGATSLIVCRDELWCATLPNGDPEADALGECALPLAPGDPCLDGDDVCTDGFCDTDAGACRAVTLVAKPGAACDKAELSICDPTLGLHCNTSGTCDASGNGHEGALCYTGDLQWGCDPELYCAKPDQATSNDPGNCRPLLADGAACTSSATCLSGNCLDSVCGGRPCLE